MEASQDSLDAILTQDQVDSFYNVGYVIVPNVISKEQCELTLDEIWRTVENHNGISRKNSATWGQPPFTRRGFIDAFPIYNLQSIWDIRQNPIVYGSFAQLLKKRELWCSIDRVSLKRPGIINGKEMKEWKCEDWHHTDLNPHFLPPTLTLQGFVVLSDTTEDQGSLHVIPGWQKDIQKWASDHPKLEKPKSQCLCPFKDQRVIETRTKKLAFKAGDLLIFDSRLVHGSYANQTERFRSFVYVTYKENEEGREETRQGRIKSYMSGKAPALSPSGHPTPQADFQTNVKYIPPQLTDLGKKLLGLESWYA